MFLVFLTFSDSLKKTENYLGWNTPNFSDYELNKSVNKIIISGNTFVIEIYKKKDKAEINFILNKKSNGVNVVELEEQKKNYEIEIVDNFMVFRSQKNEKVIAYKVFCITQSDFSSFYYNKMNIKKNTFGWDGGIESGCVTNYYLLDYDSDGIFETRINGLTKEEVNPEEELKSVLNDYLKFKVINKKCVSKLSEFKFQWVNYIKEPSFEKFLSVYNLFPGRQIKTLIDEFDLINKTNDTDSVENSEKHINALNNWQEQSVFFTGKMNKEERELFKHIENNLNLITREFIYGNSSAVGFALKLYPILRGKKSLELDEMLVDFCMLRPEDFLFYLKKHKDMVRVFQAIDRTQGFESVGLKNIAIRETKILISKIQSVNNKELFDIKDECLQYLKKRLYELGESIAPDA
jgi:hypothetical protein